jgi:cytochrome c oxidase cbb3-type subunit III
LFLSPMRCATSLMLLNTKSLGLSASLLLIVSVFVAQAQNPSQKRPTSSKADSIQGKRAFTSTCAQCHGLDGKGSERGPNIAERPSVQRLSDLQIFHVIENGVPGTGMPAFHSLQDAQIRALVAYLRTLQGKNKTAALPGNPEQGKTIFFGKAACSECHMVAGEGGFIASDLSDYAQSHTIEQIRNAIVDPANDDKQVRLVTATLRDGAKFEGRVRDEDNFSIQLQTLDGTFHFLSRSEIDKIEPGLHSLMPSDYGSRLDPRELNDLVSYLLNVARDSGSPTPAKVDEWEQ